MILLNKKRIILFIVAIFISIIVYFIFVDNKENSRLLPVSNMGLNKKTVIIDPGHRSS